MRADKKLAAATLASMALFGAQQVAQAKAVMIPFIAVGNGWQTIVSYVYDGGTLNTLHIAYNLKPAVTTGACLHTDGIVSTSPNDLTSFFVDGTTNTPGTIYGDTTGGAYAPVVGATTYFGFMAVATESAAAVSLGTAGLAVETISYNAGLRFLYAQRSIDLNHTALNSAVAFLNTGLVPGQTTKFMSFANPDSNPYVYAVGVNTINSVFDAPYSVFITLNKTNNAWWDRIERQFSDNISLSDQCVTLWPVCAPSSAPTTGFISNLNCQAGTIFAKQGGWFHLVNSDPFNNAIVFKVESNPNYGYAVTPLHPLQYTTE
ncbi:hypothetical protein [Hydrogenobacter hydrogenophilus]|uniref:Uncharacterized protein n=1 Tax=Hydrogenobacter hydrogenophilus TaxID=35835 RepID=A0A285NRG0_9AQUI|nr:hypothetical protein [Hydrogenobacter hydrogenophilus]SNZ12114.1 hypothetical protein SAMN06265353_0435 [Hydrogenobacter hydrogenophilus]